ncbi:MAG: hypothetical protein P8Z41_14865 [Anaerolineales bacterium]
MNLFMPLACVFIAVAPVEEHVAMPPGRAGARNGNPTWGRVH